MHEYDIFIIPLWDRHKRIKINKKHVNDSIVGESYNISFTSSIRMVCVSFCFRGIKSQV